MESKKNLLVAKNFIFYETNDESKLFYAYREHCKEGVCKMDQIKRHRYKSLEYNKGDKNYEKKICQEKE